MVLSFPALVLLISVVAFVGTASLTISLVLGFLSIPVYARMTRAHTLAVGKREFITAARAIGMRTSRILWQDRSSPTSCPRSSPTGSSPSAWWSWWRGRSASSG